MLVKGNLLLLLVVAQWEWIVYSNSVYAKVILIPLVFIDVPY